MKAQLNCQGSASLRSGGEYNSETDDPFNSVLYRVLPSQNATHIHFYAAPLFKTILSVMEKEFRTLGNDINKLKTMTEGKRCHICVDRSDLSIVATGPGDVCWKESNFRKMTLNMFQKFVDKTNSSLNTKTMDNIVPAASGESDDQCSTHQDDSTASTVNPELLELLNTGNSQAPNAQIIQNISALMDKIHVLQGQVMQLTTEVNKLVIQVSTPLGSSVRGTSRNSQTARKPGSENTVDIDTENEITHEDSVIVQENGHELNRCMPKGTPTTPDNMRLTSTPIPRTQSMSSKTSPGSTDNSQQATGSDT